MEGGRSRARGKGSSTLSLFRVTLSSLILSLLKLHIVGGREESGSREGKLDIVTVWSFTFSSLFL